MQKQRPIRDKEYLRFLHDIGVCCNVPLGLVCRGDIVAHHVRIGMNGGTGIKPSDCYCVPLCAECHNRVHRGERTFWKNRTPLELADALWHVWTIKGISYQSKLGLGRQKVLQWRAHGKIN